MPSQPSPVQQSRDLLGEVVQGWLSAAQALEAAGKMEGAVAAYGEILTRLRQHPPHEHAGYALGLVAMNRGNALLRLNRPETVQQAIVAYDEAIVHLAADSTPLAAASRAAARMNRGVALLQGPARDPSAAAQSFRTAAREYDGLPLDWPPHRHHATHCRLNEAAAWLQVGSAEAVGAANQAAEAALGLAVPLAADDPTAATLLCAATETLCATLRRAAAGDSAEARTARGRASDALDAALALVRDWERRQPGRVRGAGQRVFRIAAGFYAELMPAFLPEVLRENLDPERSPEPWARDPALRAVAAEAAARVWHEAQNERIRMPGTQGAELAGLVAELEALRPWLRAAGPAAA